MTVTITITMTGLEAVRTLNEREPRKQPGLQRIDHKKRTSLPIQYDFPYRYVFPANHPYSSYAQFLGLPAAATPQYNSGGGSPGYDMYAQVPPGSPFIPSLYQHQHLHQHQHQLQLQQTLQPQPPQPPPPLPLPPQNAQPEFKYVMRPGAAANGHHHQQHAAASNNVHLGPFQSGSAAPTVLLLHASNPAAGSVQTFLLIPASTTDGGQSYGVGSAISPNLLSALAGAAGGPSGTLPASAQMSMPGVPNTAPIMMRPPPADPSKLANGHFLNQLTAAQLMSRPVNGGVYQLPLMPPNSSKYYKRKQSSIEAKMSQADSSHAPHMSSRSTSTESTTSPIRNGHAPRILDQENTSSDTFEEYVPESGPLAPKKRS